MRSSIWFPPLVEIWPAPIRQWVPTAARHVMPSAGKAGCKACRGRYGSSVPTVSLSRGFVKQSQEMLCRAIANPGSETRECADLEAGNRGHAEGSGSSGVGAKGYRWIAVSRGPGPDRVHAAYGAGLRRLSRPWEGECGLCALRSSGVPPRRARCSGDRASAPAQECAPRGCAHRHPARHGRLPGR